MRGRVLIEGKGEGALLRLTALCTDEASAARLTQALLARAAEVIYGIQV